MHVDFAGNGDCDDRFDCEALGYDWGDCTIVKDCDGFEFSSAEVASVLGNGECDDGDGDLPNLACDRFEYDEGDCTKPVLSMHAMQFPRFTMFTMFHCRHFY